MNSRNIDEKNAESLGFGREKNQISVSVNKLLMATLPNAF